MNKQLIRQWIPGFCAGLMNGLLGAGGGMVLIPLLQFLLKPDETDLFPMSVSIMLPICVVSLVMTGLQPGSLPINEAWSFLVGGGLGGILAGVLGQKIPVLWLHRGLGLMIIWGGIRYLC